MKHLALLAALCAAAPPVVPPKPMNTSCSTSFVVYPADCNHMGSLFGGRLLAEMDRTAGITVRRLLYASPNAKAAVTVSVEKVKFRKPGAVGDLVFITGTVMATTDKMIILAVKAEVEEWGGERILLADGMFVFAAYDKATKKSIPHGLEVKK